MSITLLGHSVPPFPMEIQAPLGKFLADMHTYSPYLRNLIDIVH